MTKIKTPAEILESIKFKRAKLNNLAERNGVKYERGAKLSKERVKKNIKLYEQYAEYFINYPDKYLELITPTTSKHRLRFYQVIFLRACTRFGRLMTIAPRAAGKSYICILALLLICTFRPNSKQFICAPGKGQSAQIAARTIKNIWQTYPLLKQEIKGEGLFGKDYVTLRYKNGSEFTIMTALDSTRGNRANGGIIDEVRDQNPDDINSIILPLLNVDRSMANGDKNEEEPQQVQMWISSASEKNSYCYDKTIEFLEQQIINPYHCFCWGFDFRVPVVSELLSKSYITEQKMSPTFNELSFAKEYMSRFVGGSEEAWFDYEKLSNIRKLVNPETHAKVRENVDFFYILSVDIARLNCQTVCTVLKVFPNYESGYKIHLVNIFILGKTEDEKVFDRQVIELKKIIEKFQPKEVVIDINGIGAPFADLMIRETYDPETQVTYPPYGFFNRDEYLLTQPRNCDCILYGIKANAQLNSDMHSTLYSKIYSGSIKFLIDEQKARIKMLSTRKGQRMTPEAQNLRMMPHELTSILINEIMNLKIKPTGNNNQIAVEQINKRTLKDKFSALEMGVFRIQEIENEALSHRRNRGLGTKRSLVFATSGNKKSSRLRGGGRR